MVQLSAAGALQNLCVNASNKKTVAAAGGVEALMYPRPTPPPPRALRAALSTWGEMLRRRLDGLKRAEYGQDVAVGQGPACQG